MENGEEYGWQAKYFSSMGNPQWSQLKKSFESALKTHPNLKKYFVCIPLDRQDPANPTKKSFMDQWKKKVHLRTEFNSGELEREATVAKNSAIAADGKTGHKRRV
ncbi:MAG: hypothetical protein H6750_18655 [Nitrospiraceae bacterium]|nr:hypothetical protein [Nitrospiraceae bacterium]